MKIVASILLFIFYLLFSFDNFSMRSKQSDVFCSIATEPAEPPLTVESLTLEIEKNEILCKTAVLAQMKLESGHFKSFLFNHTNNLMGMRYPFSRTTCASGIYIPSRDTIIHGTQDELLRYRNISNTYACYDSWKDAVKDYKLWQQHCFNLDERYLAFLSRVYAEDEHYIHKIRRMSSGE